MLDMSWGEVMLIGGVALIVIGPKDLPKALRTVGQVTTKLRRMAGEFQMQFNEAIREAELDEVRKEVDGLRNAARSSFNPVQTIRDELKGAVEGRSETRAKVAGVEVAGVESAPIATAEAEVPAAEPHGPEPVPPAMGPPAPHALAAATARLKAEQGDAHPPAPAHGADVPGAAPAYAADEPPLPVPGSVDDPFGQAPEPAAPERAAGTAR